MKKSVFIFLTIFNLSFSCSFATPTLITIGSMVAILADSQEWNCYVLSDKNPGVTMNVQKYIKGNSKHYPVNFLFYKSNLLLTPSNIELFLIGYALETNTILYNVKKKEHSINKKIVYEGDYQNSQSSGHFRVLVEFLSDGYYVFFFKTESQLIDENTRTIIYENARGLTIPLYSPKALSLWINEVEETRKEQDVLFDEIMKHSYNFAL